MSPAKKATVHPIRKNESQISVDFQQKYFESFSDCIALLFVFINSDELTVSFRERIVILTKTIEKISSEKNFDVFPQDVLIKLYDDIKSLEDELLFNFFEYLQEDDSGQNEIDLVGFLHILHKIKGRIKRHIS